VAAALAAPPAIAATERQLDTQPSSISIHMEAATPEKVYEALAKQAGVKFHRETNNGNSAKEGKHVDVNFDTLSFWDALQTIQKATGVWAYILPGELRFPGPFYSTNVHPHAVSRGMASLEFAQMKRAGSIWRNAPAQRDLQLHFILHVEPKIQIERGTAAIVFTQATDDTGRSLIPKTSRRATTSGMDKQILTDLFCAMDLPAAEAKRLAVVQGKVAFQVVSKIQTLQVPLADLKTGFTTELLGYRAVFEPLVIDGIRHDINYTFYRGDKPLQDWERFRSLVSQPESIRVLDTQGQQIVGHGVGGHGAGDMIEYTYGFMLEKSANQPARTVATLIWEMTSESVPMEVPFEFKDLPLP
jgi:hypothetical protein